MGGYVSSRIPKHGSYIPFLLAMGKVISDEEKHKEAWDSNAITPGTPFMDLLAASLRYWVVEKINTDPGWKDVRRYFFPS